MRTPTAFLARSLPTSTLALDVTALWNHRTTGIQRVIRAVTPYLAAAAAQRNCDVVLVRCVCGGLEQLAVWSGPFDAIRVGQDLNRIAAGELISSDRLTLKLNNFVRATARAVRQSRVRLPGLKTVSRNLQRMIPSPIQKLVPKRNRANHLVQSSIDAYLSFSAGILPARPPASVPSERAVFVIHDLIPLHHAHYCDDRVVQGFAGNFAELACSRFLPAGRIVTASQYVAADLRELFHAFARKNVRLDILNWGYDRETFYPEVNPQFRREHRIPEDALLVSAVSTQDPRKRFADIQTAVAKLNAYAVFLGQGKPRREGNAIYLGYVSDKIVRQAYSSSDVVVNWSAAEGFGLSTIEALACGGRVVVPPDNPTSLEVGGDHVFMAQRADPESLCDAIHTASRSPRSIPDLSRFDWAKSAAVLESLLWP